MLIHVPYNARRRWLALTGLLVAAIPLGWTNSTLSNREEHPATRTPAGPTPATA